MTETKQIYEYEEKTDEDGYGYRELYIVRKGGNNNFNDITLHVCRTGKKEQYYTLYYEGVVYNGRGAAQFQYFVQNLSHKADDATEKAFARARELADSGVWLNVRVEHHEEPRPVYTKYEAFGLTFNLSNKKNKKGNKTWYATPNQEFWDLWNKDKAAIKKDGYRCFKTDDGDWLVLREGLVIKSMKDIMEII